jgi:anti-sigma regulatory factor (Ser/Thr protein kinase)
MVNDLESLSKEALIISPEYLNLPDVHLEDILTKDYNPLDGSSDVMPFHDEIYSDFIREGLSEKCVNNFVFAVVEAIQNAQEHGYKWQKYDSKGNINSIVIGGIFTPKYDVMGISSKGTIDIDKIKKLISENETIRYTPRGRGFYFMVKICDVVYPHQDEGYMEILLILMKDKFYKKD